MTRPLHAVPDPPSHPEEGPTERGRALIQGARWRLQQAKPWRPVFGDEAPT